MSDVDLVLDEHRPVADGTRPLQVGQPTPALAGLLLEGAPSRACADGRSPQCRIRIVPGEHYLLWREHDLDGKPTGRTAAYCAPCAVREWAHWQVSEATS